ncbi:hypothetical protein RhiJN_03284 [Ceratobasidium sp. AG-Ba]|nr:hypothetical protein RhiJN_03284 [Ceratobasidium sp. AG-Ba]
MFIRFTAVSMLGALTALGTVQATTIDARFGFSFGSSLCQSDHFWYDRLGCCLKNGGESTTPPKGLGHPVLQTSTGIRRKAAVFRSRATLFCRYHRFAPACTFGISSRGRASLSSHPPLQLAAAASGGAHSTRASPLVALGTPLRPATLVQISGVGCRHCRPASRTSQLRPVLHLAATTGSGTLENNAALQAEAEETPPLRTLLVNTLANVMLRYTNVHRFALALTSLAPSLVRMSTNALIPARS